MESPKLDVPLEELFTFLAKETDYKFGTGNKIYNTIQQYKKALILDLRAEGPYKQSHLIFSVNVPNTSLTAKELMEYNPATFAEKHMGNAKQKEQFNQRRRLMVFIIPSNNSVRSLCHNPHLHFETLSTTKEEDKSKYFRARGLAFAYLIFQSFKKEKVREVYIIPDGFKDLLNRYPFLCEFSGNKLYLEP